MKTLAIVLVLVSLVAVGLREFSKQENSKGNKGVAVANDLKSSGTQKLEVVKTVNRKSRMGGGLQANVQKKSQSPVTREVRKVSFRAEKSFAGVKEGGAVIETRSAKEVTRGDRTPIVFSEDSSDRWVEMAYFFNPGGGLSSHVGSETFASNDNSVVDHNHDNHDQDDWGHKEVADRSFRDNDLDHDRFEKPDRPGRDDDREQDRFEKAEHHGK